MSKNDTPSNSEQKPSLEESTIDNQSQPPKDEDSGTGTNPVDLDAELSALRNFHQKEGEIPKKTRKKILKTLKKKLIARRKDFIEAVNQDFNGRSSYETLAAEVLLVCNSIRHTLRHIDEWTEVQDKEVDLTFWPASIYQRPQALGVVGVMSPWNYPIALALTPIIQALSAGNRVLLKPSEHTPKTSALLADLIKESIGPDYVRVAMAESTLV
jgi:coniferyl-aldehyde dehydrogenase